MRLRRRASLWPTFCFSILTLTAAPTAFGSSIAGYFGGTFYGPAPAPDPQPPAGIVAKQPLSGNFSYNTSDLSRTINGTYSYTYSNTFSAANNGQNLGFTIINQLSSSNPTMYPPSSYPNFNDLFVTGYFGITISETVNIVGSTATVTGATLDLQSATSYLATINLVLNSTAFNGKVFSASQLALPTTTTALGKFLGGSENLSYDAPFDFYNNAVTINVLIGPSSVPEPSGLVLAFGALVTGGIGCFATRRKVAAKK